MRRDIILKTAGIFERIVKKKIYVKFVDRGEASCSQYSREAYLITFPEILPEHFQPYWYRTFEHELSHIVFQSSFSKMRVFVSEFSNAPSLAAYVLNLVEDVRVDSLWNEVYPGSAKIRRDELESVAPYVIRDVYDPILKLLAGVYFRAQGIDVEQYFDPEELQIVEELGSEVEKVKLKGFDATLVVATKVMKRILKLIEKRERQQDPNQQPKKQKGRGQNPAPGEGREEEKEDENTPLKQLVQQVNELIRNNKDELYNLDRKVMKVINKDDHKFTGRSLKKDIEDIKELLEKATDEIEKEAKAEGQKELRKIKRKLTEFKPGERVDPKERKTYGKVKKIKVRNHILYNVRLDLRTARKLRYYFVNLKLKYHQSYDEEGEEIDIDNYISHLRDTEKPVFIAEKQSQGAYIAMVLDYSMSMENDNKILRLIKACLTIEQAVKGLPITVEFFPFSGENDNVLLITKVTKGSDLTKIPTQGYTPTHLAIQWISEEVIQHPQRKKFVILVTDGLPEDGSHRRSILMKWTHNAIEKLRRKGVEVFTLFINPTLGIDLSIYGPKGTWIVATSSDLDSKLVEFFSMLVSKIMKG